MNYFIGSGSPHRYEDTAAVMQGAMTYKAFTVGTPATPGIQPIPMIPEWPNNFQPGEVQDMLDQQAIHEQLAEPSVGNLPEDQEIEL